MRFQILLSLRDDVRDADAMLRFLRELNPRGASPPIASFYRGLKREHESGHIDILEAEPEERRGRPRQRYRITKAGRRALAAEGLRLSRLARLALATPVPEEESR